MSKSGYREVTYFRPQRSPYGPACEVYGATGYGWYTDKSDARTCFPRTGTTPSKNPLFVYLDGMTTGYLASRGFFRT